MSGMIEAQTSLRRLIDAEDMPARSLRTPIEQAIHRFLETASSEDLSALRRWLMALSRAAAATHSTPAGVDYINRRSYVVELAVDCLEGKAPPERG